MVKKRKKTHARTRSLSRQVYLGCFVITLSVWGFILNHNNSVYMGQWLVSSVRISLHSPLYLSANDNNTLRIALENTDDQDVNVTVRLGNDETIAGFWGKETNVFYTGTIEGREQINRQLLVFIPRADNVLGNMTGLSLQGNIGNTSLNEKLPIRMAPIPKIKSIGNYLNGIFLVVIGSAIGLLNDLLRQSLEIDKKKK